MKKNITTVRLLSVNIEGKKHLPLVLQFLQTSDADIICLQEVFEDDFNEFKKIKKMHGEFAGMIRHSESNIFSGIGILTSLKNKDIRADYYFGDTNSIPVMLDNLKGTYRVLLWGNFFKENERFIIGTTHFTWTPDGQADDNQRHDLDKFFKILESIPELVFCGDFNAPRGREIFEKIAAKYKDNIPLNYESSLDPMIHKDGGRIKVMVDGIFSTQAYQVEDVKFHHGVSDHCAITAGVTRRVNT